MVVGFISKKRTVWSLLAAAVVTVGGIPAASAAFIDGNWNVNATGNWSDATKWSSNPDVPGGAGATVGLTFAITSNRTVTIDTVSETVGTLNIGNTGAARSYTLAAGAGLSLIFDNGAADAILNQTSTSNGDKISAPVALNSSLDIKNASATQTLTLSGGISAGTTGLKTITNSGTAAGTVSITGAITDGAGTVEVVQNSATSPLSLATTSSFSGGVTIDNGNLLASAGALGNGPIILGDISGSANASLLVAGANSSIASNIDVRQGSSGTLTIGNTGAASNTALTINGNITLEHNVMLQAGNSGGNITVAGAIAGTQSATITATATGSSSITISGAIGANITSVIQNDANTLTLSGTNTNFTGDLHVDQGTVGFGQLSLGTANTVYVNLGATLNKGNGGGSSSGRSDVGGIDDGTNGGGTVTRGTSSGTRPLEIGGTGVYSFSGAIVDGNATNLLNIIKINTGIQTLSGPNTYSGGTTIVGGTIKLDASTGSLAPTGALTMQGGTFVYDNTNSASVGKTQGLGALTFSAGGSTIQSVLGGASSATLTFASLVAPLSTGATGNFVVTGGTDGTTNSIVLTGSSAGFQNQGLFYNGANYAYLATAGGFVGAATYGTTTGFANQSSTGAALTSANHNLVTSSIASQATVSVNTVKFSGTGPVDLTLANSQTLTLSNGGLLRAGGGSTTISGTAAAITTISNGDYVFRTDTANDSLAINTPIKNSGTNALVKDGAGTLTLGADNLYTGATYVNGGILSISRNANLGAPATGAALNLNNGTLQATDSFGLYNGVAGANDRKVVIYNNGTFDITGTNTLAITGVVSDNWLGPTMTNSYVDFQKGSLIKTDTGTLTLSAANTYNGSTVVNGGTLLVNGSLASSDVSVNNTGTLGGSGVITGPVSVNSGGTISPGNSPGILTVGGLAMVTNSTLAIDLNGLTVGTGYDRLVVTGGTPTLGNATLSLASIGYTPGTSDEFAILDNQTMNAINGTFVGLSQDAVATTIDGQAFRITYVGDTSSGNLTGGNDVILYAAPAGVPEPASLALLGMGAVALLRRRRRS